jgi:CBS domain-containing protein
MVTGYANVQDAIRLMIENQSILLPVIQAEDNPVLVGVISLMDVFSSLDLAKVSDKPVSEVMSKKVVTTNVDEPVTKVWDKMTSEDFTGLPVVNGKGEPVGMVTKSDIFRHGWARISKEDTSKTKEATHIKVQKVMSTPLYSITPDDNVKMAIEMMLKYGMGRVTVVKDGKLAGIVDRYDLIKSYLGE